MRLLYLRFEICEEKQGVQAVGNSVISDVREVTDCLDE